MKKLLIFSFFLAFVVSCKKNTITTDPVADATLCLIQKIDYEDGYYEKYTFDANKKLISSVLTYEDENGKIAEFLNKYEYNAAGNLLKTTGQDGGTDSYVYDASGLLTSVVFKDSKNEIYEQFTVSMDSQKRLTKVVAKFSELTGLYEYNGQDNALSKIDISFQGKVFDRYVVEAYESDKTKKEYEMTITGHPFDPSAFTSSMLYYPFNLKPNSGLPTKGKASTTYDEKWENLTNNLRVYYDYSATRKYNTNNFVIERTSNDAIEKKSLIKKYNYSNCN